MPPPTPAVHTVRLPLTVVDSNNVHLQRGPCHEKPWGPLSSYYPLPWEACVASQHLFLCRDGALTPPSLAELLLLATTGYDAQTHAVCSPHHRPALPRQHTAYHPLSPLEIWHHPASLMLRWPEHPSKGVARWEINARDVWLKGWKLITRKQDCVFFFPPLLLLLFQLTGLHVYSGKSCCWPGGGAIYYWFHIAFIWLDL